jgi:hypothetical protein
MKNKEEYYKKLYPELVDRKRIDRGLYTAYFIYDNIVRVYECDPLTIGHEAEWVIDVNKDNLDSLIALLKSIKDT